MTINRHNYEEFFMLYADDELSAELRLELEDFVEANPDLKEELGLLLELKFQPDAALTFEDKSSLLKSEMEDGLVNADNYESFFVQYQDGELNANEKQAVDEFLVRNPSYVAGFEILQQVRLEADDDVVYRDKESLFRYEKDRRVIAYRWWVPAAAALVLVMAGIFWIMRPSGSQTPTLAGNGGPVKTQAPQKNLDGAPQKAQANNANASTNLAAQTQPSTETLADNRKTSRASINIPDKGENVSNQAQPDNNVAAQTVEPGNTTNAILASVEPSIEVQRVKKPDVEVRPLIIDKPADLVGAPQENREDVTFASQTEQDKLEILNTSVTTKNSLRVFLRKTSRLIAKKSNLGNDEGEHKGILIGGFEIAVK